MSFNDIRIEAEGLLTEAASEGAAVGSIELVWSMYEAVQGRPIVVKYARGGRWHTARVELDPTNGTAVRI